MHQTSFLQDLAIVMSVAALATVIFRQFKSAGGARVHPRRSWSSDRTPRRSR